MTMIGIDPHKATHTAVAIDDDEGVIDLLTLQACPGQADRLVAWADGFTDRVWAIEAANGLGRLVARELVARGETVVDVPPVLASRVRLMGSGRSQKNDPNDARSVAVAALRSDHLARVTADDAVTVLRLLVKRHRDLAQSKAKTANRLHALLIELVPGGIVGKINVRNASSLLDDITRLDEPTRIRVLVAREIIADMQRLDDASKTSKRRIAEAVATAGTTLTDIAGIGPIGAATIIGYTTDITRFPTKGHYATYNGTAPIEASSGARTRHRLNPRGNRIINHAIHIAAVTQLRPDTNGRTYYQRKLAEGKTSKEAIRALKRRISDAVYRQLTIDAANS